MVSIDKLEEIVTPLIEQAKNEGYEDTESIVDYILRTVFSNRDIARRIFQEVFKENPDLPILVIARNAHTNEHTALHDVASIFDYEEPNYKLRVGKYHIEDEINDEGDLAGTFLVGRYLTFFKIDNGRLEPYPLPEKLYSLISNIIDIVIKKLNSNLSGEEQREIFRELYRSFINEVEEFFLFNKPDSITNNICLVPLYRTIYHDLELRSPFEITTSYISNVWYEDYRPEVEVSYLDNNEYLRKDLFMNSDAIVLMAKLAGLGLLENKDVVNSLLSYAYNRVPNDIIDQYIEEIKRENTYPISRNVVKILDIARELFYGRKEDVAKKRTVTVA